MAKGISDKAQKGLQRSARLIMLILVVFTLGAEKVVTQITAENNNRPQLNPALIAQMGDFGFGGGSNLSKQQTAPKLLPNNVTSKVQEDLSTFATKADMNISPSKVRRYDPEILDAFNNASEVRIIVKLQDKSNITISGSKDERRAYLRQKDEWFKIVVREIVATLSQDEFESFGELSDGFAGKITKEGFDKLVNDDRVAGIYLDKIVYAALDSSGPTINADDVWALSYTGNAIKVCVLDTGIDYDHANLGGCFGSQRWLINYITSGEGYVRAPNLTTAVYVLEITSKTSAQITDEVSGLINATKS